MRIKAENISKTFDKKTKVLENLNVEIESGSLTTLLGLSGCGKTTLLKIIAGLEESDSGSIALGDNVVFDKDKKINLSPIERNVGFVFQDFALWPNMNVLQNVMFGIENRQKRPGIKHLFKNIKEQRNSMKEKAMECLKMVRMDSFASRLPSELSGGQKQRVAIARAIAIDPDVILFDEPLSALDALLREEMRTEIRNLVKKLGMTAVFVTHDQEEAMSISDSIIIMNKGEIVEKGTPKEIYWSPKTKFVANFIGKASFVDENHFLRPEDISLSKIEDSIEVNANVVDVQSKGGSFSYKAEDEKGRRYFFSSIEYFANGSSLSLYYKEENLREAK